MQVRLGWSCCCCCDRNIARESFDFGHYSYASVVRTPGENTTPLTRMGPDSFNNRGIARICGRAVVTRIDVCVLLYTRRKLQQSWTKCGAKSPQTLSDCCRQQTIIMDGCGRYNTVAEWNNVDVGFRRVGPTNWQFKIRWAGLLL